MIDADDTSAIAPERSLQAKAERRIDLEAAVRFRGKVFAFVHIIDMDNAVGLMAGQQTAAFLWKGDFSVIDNRLQPVGDDHDRYPGWTQGASRTSKIPRRAPVIVSRMRI